MEYLDIEISRYADVPFFQKLRNNFSYFIEKLEEYGYISPLLPVDLWQEVSYNKNIKLLREELFNAIEKATYDIDSNCDWINDFSYYVDYGEENPVHWFEWDKKQSNKFSLVKRWLDWMEYNRKIIQGEEQKKQYLYVKTEELENEAYISEELFDESGEKIITLEGYFSGGIN